MYTMNDENVSNHGKSVAYRQIRYKKIQMKRKTLRFCANLKQFEFQSAESFHLIVECARM